MKIKGKAWHLVVTALLILVFAFTAFFGVSGQYGETTTTYVKGASDIRFGVDIKGGVNVTFKASESYDATEEQMDAAKSVIENRLVALNITDYEVYVDNNAHNIILEFPWQSGEENFDPEAAIKEIGTTAYMTFRKGEKADGELILDGSMVKSAQPAYGPVQQGGASEYYVVLNFDKDGGKAFGDATTQLAPEHGAVSIWLDDQNVSVASVNTPITNGEAIITNRDFTQDEVVQLARQINSGALPFSLEVEGYETKSPTLGENSLEAMVKAGVIAFVLIFLFMTLVYRLPGFLAGIALLGQVAATLAFVSGYFTIFPSFTLTLPGIAGIILAIGMGVDANVITAERIREELGNGKSIEGAIKAGFKRGLAPIIDGNVTIVIVAIVLMGAFGPTDSMLAKLLSPLFFAFGPSTTGTIYAFGYTLLVGVMLNFVFGVGATRLMIRGAAGIRGLRQPWLFGAKSNEVVPVQESQPKVKYDVTGKRKIFLSAVAVILVVILAGAGVFGVKLDTSFTGGAIITLGYEGDLDVNAFTTEAQQALGTNHLNVRTGVNAATGDKTVTINMPGTETVSIEQVQELTTQMEKSFQDNAIEQLSLSNVSPTMGGKFLRKSLVAVVFALLLILIYVAIRFSKIGGLTGGAMAIVALVTDLAVVFGSFVFMRAPLDGNFIAAMLTILGYSINDTVVLYDRIREDGALMGKKLPFDRLVNLSINQSMRRTIITTVTTVMALAVMCVVAKIYGLNSVFTFAFPLMMGMISGVFTSLCISTSCWVSWELRGKKAEKNG